MLHSNSESNLLSNVSGLGRLDAPCKLRQGLRFFECECNYKWQARTRDCHSPSGENCPKCDEWNFPVDYEERPDFPVDSSGNLLD